MELDDIKLYNYHTHTVRCGHARGKDEEYVINAIKAGFKYLGFSDHVYLSGIYQKGSRGDFEELEDYVNSVFSLREKYKDKIKIYLGFECEYFKKFESYFRELKEKRGFQYLILGQHFVSDETSDLVYIMDHKFDMKYINKYVDELIKGMASGLFLYVAHPDLFRPMFDKWDENCVAISKRICEASLKYDIPLEINLNGMKWDTPDKYPCRDFWKIVGEYGCKVTVGVDAHYPDAFLDSGYKEALEIITDYKLNFIKEPLVK